MMPRNLLLPSMLFLLFAWIAPVQAQSGGPILSFPSAGEALQGVVNVRGSSAINGFDSAELAFAYSSDPTGTWFLVATFDQPASNEVLTAWDTTGITDGNYVLRLRVILEDGSSQEALVPGLRVRNYSAIETSTPLPTAAQPSATPTELPLPTPHPTASLLPHNPAEVAPRDVGWSLGIGGATALSFLSLLGLYQWIRRRRS